MTKEQSEKLQSIGLPDDCIEKLSDALDIYNEHEQFTTEKPGLMEFQDKMDEISRLAKKLNKRLAGLSEMERGALRSAGFNVNIRRLNPEIKKLSLSAAGAGKSKTAKRVLTKKRHDKIQLAYEANRILAGYGFEKSIYRDGILAKTLEIVLCLEPGTEIAIHLIRQIPNYPQV